ncbi:DUF2844 domain-containing protein, partial [Ramlibacter alkalitolerans]
MIRILVASVVLAAGGAWAGLDEAPTRGDDAAVQTSQGSTVAGAPYTVVHRTLRTGVVVDQYVDGTGRVFALAWSGPFKPNLKRLLGRHFEAYRARGAARHGGPHSRLAVDTGEAVVVSEGHMGAFQGRAWLPSRLPAGFDTRE